MGEDQSSLKMVQFRSMWPSSRRASGSSRRVSAVALLPLTLWFAAVIIAHSGSDYATFTAWMRTPLAATLMILLLIALFHHTALGLQWRSKIMFTRAPDLRR